MPGVMRKTMKNDIKFITAIVLLLLSFSPAILLGQATERHNYKPAAGYVPDEETAIRIAIAVWIPIYGKDQIEKEKPYEAVLRNGIWYVSGSLPADYVKGGVAHAEIAKDDGRIVRISHGK
jgi:hypothetical protein